ncbi:hypothetical protein GF371_02315 [Candidatus Woesearchaeota archaeon]|nr:hypothetical protein [Candidatus Woesearchaeota archaeon]
MEKKNQMSTINHIFFDIMKPKDRTAIEDFLRTDPGGCCPHLHKRKHIYFFCDKDIKAIEVDILGRNARKSETEKEESRRKLASLYKGPNILKFYCYGDYKNCARFCDRI